MPVLVHMTAIAFERHVDLEKVAASLLESRFLAGIAQLVEQLICNQ